LNRGLASCLDWLAGEGRRAYGDTLSAGRPSGRMFVIKHSVGAGLGITPWNFPIALVTQESDPPLAAGNTSVLKPTEQAPLSSLAVLGEELGAPRGGANVIADDAGDAPELFADAIGQVCLDMRIGD
jgi:acyl-CoA reductase-like NAD-dependent aldehyde dehydrogenase